MARRGFTLIELTVYIFLALLAGMLVMTLFTLGRRAQQSTLSSYLVSADADTAIRWLRNDLHETALVSLRSYPAAGFANEPPGCSFASARNPSGDPDTQLNVSPYGAPLWTKTVYYTLVRKNGERTGQLVRWEKDLTAVEKDFVPRASSTLPSAIPGGDKTRRVVLRGVLAPNTKVENLGGDPGFQSDDYGGFRVQFVRRAGGETGTESVSAVNPADLSTPTNAADNTHLVEVELMILTSDTSRPTLFTVKFHVHPRY